MQKTATAAPRRAMRLQIDLYYRWKLFNHFSQRSFPTPWPLPACRTQAI
jgi:hypothetical protein